MILRVDYISALKRKAAAEICLQCGVCCVVDDYFCHVKFDGQFDAKRTFVYDCLEADKPSENPNIWLCVSCHKCEESCPYEVAPISFIEAMKAKAFDEGYAHPLIMGEVKQVLSTGYAFPITPAAERGRKSLGLESLKMKAAGDIKRIAKETGFTRNLRRKKEVEG